MVPVNERRFNRWAIALLAAAFILLGAAFVAAIRQAEKSRKAGDMVEHTLEVLDTVGMLEIYMERAETASRGWLLIPEQRRLDNFRASADQILPTYRRLTDLISDNPKQTAAVKALKPELLLEVTTLEAVIDRAKLGDKDGAFKIFYETAKRYNVSQIRAEAGAIRAEEVRLLALRRAAEHGSMASLQLVMGIVGLLLLALAVLTFFLVRRYTGVILASRQRLHELNTNLEGEVVKRTADLTRANDEIQRFAYIVSHDLRSPLVNVMGFTSELQTADTTVAAFVEKVEASHPEMVDDAVRFAVREDIPESIGFIRSATQKMDRLINAILDLSRQGRRSLSPEPLEMGDLLGDIAASLTTLAEGRGATIRIEQPLPTIRHDRLAIEQIFQNLIENATKYGQLGRPTKVVVRGALRGARAVFEVEDNGRGVAPHDLERIFELFRRAGTQDQQGEGIGLANVRALAYRLGGSVTIRSTQGEGSTFTVDLPVEQNVEKESQE